MCNSWLGKSIRIFLIMLLSTVAFGQTTPASVSSPATPEEYVHSLIGQKLLMLQFGDADHTEIKKSDLVNVLISCDIAVQIRGVDYKERKLSFDWKQIGTPDTGKNIPRYCRDNKIHPEGTLIITDLALDETAASLAELISKVLQTPEQYLAALGVPFHTPPDPNTEGPLMAGATRPRDLLTVDGTFSDEARKKKYYGTVKVRLVIGTDGHVHHPEIISTPGMGLDEQALAVLPLWRFQPASKNGKAVAVQINMEMAFNLY